MSPPDRSLPQTDGLRHATDSSQGLSVAGLGPKGELRSAQHEGSPVSLIGTRVEMAPLQTTDADALLAAAADGELWKLPFTVVPDAATVHAWIDRAVEGRETGTVMPFVIRLLDTGQVIGSTRFWKIDHANRKLEIGQTWVASSRQRSFVNTETKLLMLRHAFDSMHCVRVQFTTDVNNVKSRAAIARLGAMQEGIIRHERIMPDGRKRDSVRFSLIDDEWPLVRAALERSLAAAPSP